MKSFDPLNLQSALLDSWKQVLSSLKIKIIDPHKSRRTSERHQRVFRKPFPQFVIYLRSGSGGQSVVWKTKKTFQVKYWCDWQVEM